MLEGEVDCGAAETAGALFGRMPPPGPSMMGPLLTSSMGVPVETDGAAVTGLVDGAVAGGVAGRWPGPSDGAMFTSVVAGADGALGALFGATMPVAGALIDVPTVPETGFAVCDVEDVVAGVELVTGFELGALIDVLVFGLTLAAGFVSAGALLCTFTFPPAWMFVF